METKHEAILISKMDLETGAKKEECYFPWDGGENNLVENAKIKVREGYRIVFQSWDCVTLVKGSHMILARLSVNFGENWKCN